ncbi:hypothetical protein [Orenia marismortui]|uniref:hypothetical protein n=1 Tax=Orenia marismortui TaxID=46469 RepID=UPI00036BD11E|nr:hypothetical protein [Orenia marismortui]
MKLWKLNEDEYCIKERLGKKVFRTLLSIEGVKYNKKTWRIEFSEDVLSRVEEVFQDIEIIKGEGLLNRLYRISKFKPRRGLMKYAVMLHEAKDYIYMILTDKAFELLEEYEGVIVAYDPKIKSYAEEIIYFNNSNKFSQYKDKKKEFSIEEIIEVLNSKQGSFLNRDPDSAPYLFLGDFCDLELSEEKKNKLFKKELVARNITAFNLEALSEERGIDREIWFPVFREKVEKEINKRQSKLNKLIEKEGLRKIFTDQKAIKLGVVIEQLANKINYELEDIIDDDWVRYYQQEKERRIYGV